MSGSTAPDPSFKALFDQTAAPSAASAPGGTAPDPSFKALFDHSAGPAQPEPSANAAPSGFLANLQSGFMSGVGALEDTLGGPGVMVARKALGLPAPSETLNARANRAGIGSDVQANGPLDYAARGAGSMLAYPAPGEGLIGTAANTAAGMVAGAAGGVGSEVGAAVAPPGWKDVGAGLGGLAAGAGTGALVGAGEAALRRNYSLHTKAADTLLGSASDPAAARSWAGTAGSALNPAAEPTMPEQLNDAGLLQAQNWARNVDQAPFTERAATRNADQVGAIQGLAPVGAKTPGQLMLDHLNTLDAAHQAVVDQATKAAQAATPATPPPVEEIGANARGAISSNFASPMAEIQQAQDLAGQMHQQTLAQVGGQPIGGPEDTELQNRGAQLRQFVQEGTDARKAAMNQAWAAARENGPIALDQKPTQDAVSQARGMILPSGGDALSPAESTLYPVIEAWKGPIDPEIAMAMRSNIGDAANSAFQSGDTRAGRRLLTVRDGIDRSIESAVDGRDKLEQSAVSAGQLDPTQTFANRLEQQVSDWRSGQRSGSAVAGAGTGNGRTGANAEAPISSASGTAGEALSGRVVAGDAASDQGLAGGQREVGLYDAVPKEPERLASFLRRQGGVQDTGGDVRHTLGGAKYRPGLINSKGLSLDDATQRAWEAGYFPEFGDERPAINDLLEKLSDDLAGRPRYSAGDDAAVAKYEQSMEHNSEIDQLADKHGVPTAGVNREQFFDNLVRKLSPEDADYEVAQLARDAAKLHMQLNPEVQPARSLEDLEREYGQEAASRDARESAQSNAGHEPAGGEAPGGEEAIREGGRGPGDTGRTDTADLSRRYALARDITRKFHAVQDNTPTGRVIARGPYGAPGKLAQEKVAGQFANSGGQQVADARNFEAAVGGKPEAIDALKDYLAFDLKSKAAPDGRVNYAAYDKWMRDHGRLMDIYPDVKAKFSTMRASQQAVDEIQTARDTLTKRFQDAMGGSDSTVMQRYVKPGPAGADAVDAYAKASGGAMQHLDDALVSKLMDKAKDGNLTPEALRSFQTQYGGALSRRPALAAKIGTLDKAQNTLAQAIADRTQKLAEFEKGSARFWLHTDPVTAVGNALSKASGRDPVQNMKEIMNAAGPDREAVAGIRRAAVDWLMKAGQSDKEAGTTGTNFLKNQAMRDAVNKNRTALSVVFGKDMATLDRIVDELRVADRSVTGSKPPIGPGTARDTHALSGGKTGTVFRTLIKAGMKGGLALAGAHFMGAEGALGAIMGEGILGEPIGSMMDSRREEVKNLMVRALQDPTEARLLLAHATPEHMPTAMQRFARRTAQGAIAGLLASRNARPQAQTP